MLIFFFCCCNLFHICAAVDGVDSILGRSFKLTDHDLMAWDTWINSHEDNIFTSHGAIQKDCLTVQEGSKSTADVKVYNSAEEFSKQFDLNVDGSIGASAAKYAAKATLSHSFKTNTGFKVQHHSAFFEYGKYVDQRSINPKCYEDRSQFDAHMLNAFEALPLVLNLGADGKKKDLNDPDTWAEYKRFLDRYGSHVITTIRTGALFRSLSTETIKGNSDGNEMKTKACASATAYGVIAEGCVEVGHAKSDNTNSLDSKTNKVAYGGDSHLNAELMASGSDPTKNHQNLVGFLDSAKNDQIAKIGFTVVWDILERFYRQDEKARLLRTGCCEQFTVSGNRFAGVFSLEPSMRASGKAVYSRKDTNGKIYLYYAASWASWVFGPDTAGQSAWGSSANHANNECPTETSGWRHWTGKWESLDLIFTCSPSKGDNLDRVEAMKAYYELFLSDFYNQEADPSDCYERGVDYSRSGDQDISSQTVASASDCQTECVENENCKAFTYNSNNRYCHLKSRIASRSSNTNAISGRRSCGYKNEIGYRMKYDDKANEFKVVACNYPLPKSSENCKDLCQGSKNKNAKDQNYLENIKAGHGFFPVCRPIDKPGFFPTYQLPEGEFENMDLNSLYHANPRITKQSFPDSICAVLMYRDENYHGFIGYFTSKYHDYHALRYSQEHTISSVQITKGCEKAQLYDDDWGNIMHPNNDLVITDDQPSFVWDLQQDIKGIELWAKQENYNGYDNNDIIVVNGRLLRRKL